MIKVGISDEEIGMGMFLKDAVGHFLQRKGLEFQIKKYNNGLEVVESNDRLDLLFIDVSMPADDIKAGKVLKQKDKDLIIVYITYYEECAVEISKIREFKRLDKPVDLDNLYSMLDEIVKQLRI